MTPIEVDGRSIGPGMPCFIAVEVGLNHNGSVETAHRMVDAAADAGVDGVKFQTYRTEDFVEDRAITYAYESGGQTVVETQWEMFKRYELPGSASAELAAHCRERSVLFFSTPTSAESLAELVALGTPLLKNGSDYLEHLPLIRAMARAGIPTVLSTGMATREEVGRAVHAFREAGGSELVLLHCTSAYPTPLDDVNLRAIPSLAAAFGCPVGLSDHTEGVLAAVAAVAVGACFLEKHFTLDKSMPGPDHRFSADPAEIARLVDEVRALERALGSAEIAPAESERAPRREYRLSCFAAKSLRAGDRLAEPDVSFRRPGTGISPARLDEILGRRLGRDVSAGHMLEAGDFA